MHNSRENHHKFEKNHLGRIFFYDIKEDGVLYLEDNSGSSTSEAERTGIGK